MENIALQKLVTAIYLKLTTKDKETFFKFPSLNEI